ncbi:unnamed protein product [Paramecium octaurelia]|uniref:Uncharacterized protein n=1 Tax=Paramecium octaurelia TaxID=43137 RepID=A0A8S1XBH7_PAROT|nr:unnamed protein product [Paramecium octaurelia]
MSFQGFLVKKTIQQFPIRQKPVYYDDYTDQNFVLFINKKLADLRFQSGSNDISAKRIMNLKIKIPKDKNTEGHKIKRKASLKRKSMSVQKDDSEKKFRYKFRSPPVKPEVRLASYLNDELLRQHQISPLYQEYKLANLKANLIKLQSKKSYQLNELNHVELEDEEQVKYFLTEICRNHPEIDVGKLLSVDVEKKELKLDNQEQILKDLVLKRIKQEELEQLMKLEEQYNQNLVNIYKETRYDQFEPEFKKQGQINMCKIKRQKEIQDKMFAEIFKVKSHRSSKHNLTKHFFQAKNKTPESKHKVTLSQQFTPSNNIFISQPTTVPMSPQISIHQELKPSYLTTSIGTFSDSKSPINVPNTDFSYKIKTIMDKCELFEDEHKISNQILKKRINLMGRELNTYFDTARCRYKNQEMEMDTNEGFDRFLQENQFKRKLIEFQVSQVQNLHEVLSQKAKRELTNNFMGSDQDKQKLF